MRQKFKGSAERRLNVRHASRRGLLALAAAVTVLAAGCGCGPRAGSRIVLLADPEGKVGAIQVATAGGEQVLDKEGQGTDVGDPEQAPSAPFLLDPESIEDEFGEALAAQPSRPATFILYFESGSGELTRESVEIVPEIIRSIEERRSVDVSVIGHTDTVGKKVSNSELSRKRAAFIGELLRSRGVSAEVLHITSHGEENLLVPTADEVPEPRNRRVEVTVR